MAESDMKTISELDVYNNTLNNESILPIVVNPDNHKVTKKITVPALKSSIAGYSITGTLTAGSTSITLNSAAQAAFNDTTPYTVGYRVSNDSKNYICINSCAAGNWATNGVNFAEYPLIDSNSTVDIYTNVWGVNPTTVSISGSSITLTFPAQSSNIQVKVRVM